MVGSSGNSLEKALLIKTKDRIIKNNNRFHANKFEKEYNVKVI